MIRGVVHLPLKGVCQVGCVSYAVPSILRSLLASLIRSWDNVANSKNCAPCATRPDADLETWNSGEAPRFLLENPSTYVL